MLRFKDKSEGKYNSRKNVKKLTKRSQKFSRNGLRGSSSSKGLSPIWINPGKGIGSKELSSYPIQSLNRGAKSTEKYFKIYSAEKPCTEKHSHQKATISSTINLHSK